MKFRFCLVGFGRWGTVYFNTIKKLNYCVVDCMVINGPHAKKYDNLDVPFLYNINEVISKREVDAFIIASPPSTHFELAKICLNNGYPVLVEKPFTESYIQACELSEVAKNNNKLCMASYQHLYAKKYLVLKDFTESEAANFYSEGLSNGPFRDNVSVFRDWGSHELAIALDLFNEFPLKYKVKKISGIAEISEKCIYSMELQFSLNRKYITLFGNISDVKRRNLFATNKKTGWVFINSLDEGGATVMMDGSLVNPNSIFTSESMPVELMLHKFIEKCKSKESVSENLILPLKVAYLLDKIESELFEENVNV
jgi:hypothetical protein